MPGGQIQILTRSGGNEFHGNVFEYFRNEALDANDWFANRAGLKRAPLRQHDFGGTFSGPVILPRFGEGGHQPGFNGRNQLFFSFPMRGYGYSSPKRKMRRCLLSLCGHRCRLLFVPCSMRFRDRMVRISSTQRPGYLLECQNSRPTMQILSGSMLRVYGWTTRQPRS